MKVVVDKLIFLVLPLLLATGARAEDRRHAERTEETSPAATDGSALPETRVLLRQDAVMKRLTDVKLPPGAIGKLLQATDKTGKLTVDQFNAIIDRLTPGLPDNVSDEQKTKLKQIFKEELGSPTILAAGREINTAFKRLRDGLRTADPAAAKAGVPDFQRPGQLPPLGNLGRLPNPTDPTKVTQFLQAQLAELNQKLESLQKGQKGEDKGGGGGTDFDGLLKALQDAGKGDKKGEEKKRDGDGGKGDEAKEAKDSHSEPSTNANSEDEDKHSNPPPPQNDAGKRDQTLAALLAGLKGGGGDSNSGSKNDNQNQKGDANKADEFKLPEKKERKESKSDSDDKKDEAMQKLLDAAKGNDDTESVPTSDEVKYRPRKLTLSGKTSTPKEISNSRSGRGGGSDGGDGGGGGGGKTSIKMGGGGGGAGGGGEDQFRGVGAVEPNFGGGGYTFDKPIALGTGATGETASAESDEATGDGGAEEAPTKAKPVGGSLDVSVHPAVDKVWLLNEVGSFQKRWCGNTGTAPSLRLLCARSRHQKPSLTSALEQRGESIDAVKPVIGGLTPGM